MLSILLVACFAGSCKATTAAQGCKHYDAKGLPLTQTGDAILSSIVVTDAFDVGSIAIRNISLQGAKLAPIKVSIGAGIPLAGGTAPRTVVLKDTRLGGTATSLDAASFADSAASAMPETPTMMDLKGDFKPSEALASLSVGKSTSASDGGSQGVWVLRIKDLTPNAADLKPITLTGWTLELCPAGPNVTAAEGPSDPSITTITAPANILTPIASTPITVFRSATPSVYGGGGGGLNMSDGGVMEELLNRLNSLSLRDVNRTTLRQALMPNGNDTLVERINNRITDLLSPLNDTRLLRNRLGSRLAGTNGTTVGLPASLNATVDDASAAVSQFLKSFQDLVNVAGGPAALSAPNATAFRSAMQQADIDTDDTTASTTPSLLSRISNGQLYKSMTDNPVTAAFMSAWNRAVSSNPFLGGTTRMAQAASDSAADQVRTRIQNLSDLTGLRGNYTQARADDLLAFVDERRNLTEAALNEQVNNYRDMVSASGNLVSQILSRNAQATSKAADSLTTALKSAIDGLGTMADTPMRQRLTTLLSQQLDSTSTIQGNAQDLGGNIQKTIGNVFNAYRDQLGSLSKAGAGLAATGLDSADFGSGSTSGLYALGNMVNSLNGVLDRYTQGTGPMRAQALSAYKQGFDYLQSQLSPLQKMIGSMPQAAGSTSGFGSGAYLKALQDLLPNLDAYGIKVGNLGSMLQGK